MSGAASLAVVIAVERPDEVVRATLRRLRAHDSESRVQLILVVADGRTAAAVGGLAPGAEVIVGPPGALVPTLWGLGIERSRATWVALGIGDCMPHGGWLARLRRVTDDAPRSLAGVGGPVTPPVAGGGREWALYLLRYSGYLAAPGGAAEEIPGDNAVYRSEALEAFWRRRREGFWEVLFHRELRAAGRELAFDPALRVRLATAPPTLRAARSRLRHGFHFGSTRRLAGWRRPLAALAAPALVPLLLVRIHRRISALRPEWRSRFRLAAPWLALFVLAWSIGETLGYWMPARASR